MSNKKFEPSIGIELIQSKWSGRCESNARPLAPEASALPIVLRPDKKAQGLLYYISNVKKRK